VRNRLRQKIPKFPEFTTIITRHRKLRSYLHRFGLTDNTICLYEEEDEEEEEERRKKKKERRRRRRRRRRRQEKTDR